MFYLFFLVGLFFLILASVFDIKFREVPDLLSYSFIFVGFALNVFSWFFYSNFVYFLNAVKCFFIFLIIGLGFYYLKFWGGGDSKLLVGLGVLFSNSFVWVLFFNIMLVGVVYGFLFGFVLFLKRRKEVLEKMRGGVNWYFVFLFFVCVFFGFFNNLFFVLGFVFAFPNLFLFAKIVEDVCMVKKVRVEDLREGDLIVEDVFVDGKKIYDKRSYGVSKKQIERLRGKLKEVLVKEGVAFVPCFLLGLLVSFIFKDVLFFF